MNAVQLIGNLCTDVELRDVGTDKKVASFLLAVDRPGDGADFVRIATWDRQAEVCAEYLTKGARVGVNGRLRSRSWEEDGKRRTIVEVVVLEWLPPLRGPEPPRPQRFTAAPMPLTPHRIECFAGRAGSVVFSMRGREFGVYLLAGRSATPSSVGQARRVLDTLRVERR